MKLRVECFGGRIRDAGRAFHRASRHRAWLSKFFTPDSSASLGSGLFACEAANLTGKSASVPDMP